MLNIIALLGPTGLGKTQIALEIAKEINAEIISCDSMQIYRDLSIGTGQISHKEQASIPHHFIGTQDLDYYYDAHIFNKLAQKKISDIHKKNKKVLLVGGSGLYARIFLYKETMLPTNKDLYNQLWKQYQNEGLKNLIEILKEKDIITAQNIDLNNPRRVVRILEAVLSHKSPLKKNPQFTQKLHKNALEFILESSIQFNRNNIHNRCLDMFRRGWIEEAKNAFKKGLFQTPTAWQAIGYKEINDFLTKKINSEEELTEKIVVKTHRYAKRQRTWFQTKHPYADRINAEKKTPPEIKETILNQLKKF